MSSKFVFGLAIFLAEASCAWAQVDAPVTHKQEVEIATELNPRPGDATLFQLLTDHQIIAELHLEKDQVDAIRQIQAGVRGAVSSLLRGNSRVSNASEKEMLIREQFERPMKAIDELLTPAQSNRLRQLANRREIYVIGYANAITRGNLAKIAEIEPEQVTPVANQIAKILGELDDAVNVLEREKEEAILSRLSPEQRKKCLESIGAPFNYIDRSQMNVIRERTWTEKRDEANQDK